MATIPAASPSRPSMKLTALIVATTTRIVSTMDWSGVADKILPPGSGTQPSSVPVATRIAPAATWPANLLIGLSPHRSSTIPMATIRPQASSSPCAIRVPAKTLFRGGSWAATSSPAARPPYIASPPSSGIGTTWTSRSRASCMAPTRIALRRTSGVSM